MKNLIIKATLCFGMIGAVGALQSIQAYDLAGSVSRGDQCRERAFEDADRRALGCQERFGQDEISLNRCLDRVDRLLQDEMKRCERFDNLGESEPVSIDVESRDEFLESSDGFLGQ